MLPILNLTAQDLTRLDPEDALRAALHAHGQGGPLQALEAYTLAVAVREAGLPLDALTSVAHDVSRLAPLASGSVRDLALHLRQYRAGPPLSLLLVTPPGSDTLHCQARVRAAGAEFATCTLETTLSPTSSAEARAAFHDALHARLAPLVDGALDEVQAGLRAGPPPTA